MATPERRTAAKSRASYDSWEFWWGYNRDAVLDLRARMRRAGAREVTMAGRIGVGKQHSRSGRGAPTEDRVRDRIVPALEEALEPDQHFEIRSAAALALAKCGATRPDLRGRIASCLLFLAENRKDRAPGYLEESAALALGLLGNQDEAVLDTLAGKIARRVGSDRHPRTRAFAAVALGLLRVGPTDSSHETVVATLRNAVADEREASDDLAVCALMGMGLSGDATFVPDLLALVRKDRTVGKRRIDDLLRSHAVSALGRIAEGRPDLVDTTLVDVVVTTLTGRGVHTPRSAAIAAGQIARGIDRGQAVRLVRALAHVASAGEAQAAHFARISLGRIAASLDDEDLRGTILQTLLEHTRQGSATSRPFAAIALGLALGPRGGGSLREGVVEAVRDGFVHHRGDPRHRGGFAIALGLLRDRTAVPALVELLEDGNSAWRLRGAAATALGMIGDPAARAPIRETIENPGEPNLRGELAVAAGLLGDHEAIGSVIEILADPRTSQYVQTSIAAAVGLVGDRRAIEPLVGIVEDRDAPCLNRALAAVALGLLADGSDRPSMTRITRDVNYRAQVPALVELLRIL